MAFKLVFLPRQTDITRIWASRIAADVPEIDLVVVESDEAAAEAIATADGAVGTLPPSLLPKAQKLRWLQARQIAPPAGYFYDALAAHPVVVTNMREIFNDHIGAHIMAFILAFARDFHTYLPQQFRSVWQPKPLDEGVIHLPDTTALIVGVGGIGAEAARLAAAFGITVIGTDARRTEAPPGLSELHPAEALDELLPRADFVVLTVPHTPTTEGFFGRERFARMKRSGFFINIGRGMTTRLDDLVAALLAGEIAGAALDVFEQEPLPPEHPLWTLPNVLITPHTAGYGPHLEERRYEILRDNCLAMLAGRPLRNIVDKRNWF